MTITLTAKDGLPRDAEYQRLAVQMRAYAIDRQAD